MDAEALAALIALVDEGSVLGAAERLGTSRATIRRRIDALEAHVGAALVDRRGETIVLTIAGEVVIERARAVLLELNALSTAARTAGSTRVGPLRVMGPDGMPTEFVAAAIARAFELFPDLQLQLFYSSDPLSERLDDIDLIVHFGPARPQGAFVSKVFLRMPECVVATRSYLNRHGTPATPADLRSHRLLTWMPTGEPPRLWPRLDGPPLEVQPTVATPDVHLVRRLMLADMGIARIPEGGLPDPMFAGELVTLFPEAFGRECTLRMLVPEALSTTPRLRQVMQFLQTVPEG